VTVRMDQQWLSGLFPVNGATSWFDHQGEVDVWVGVIEEAVVIEHRTAGRPVNNADIALVAGVKGRCEA
jgi:hypothetical protein